MGRSESPEHGDYDERYRDRAGQGGPPWEIGGPQPALVALIARTALDGRILDLGCGTGELALHLAARGQRVTGFDIAAVAIARAREKAAARGLAVDFRVADATQLAGSGERFETVFDSGLLHVPDETARVGYRAGLSDICADGATLHLLTRAAGHEWGVTEDEIRAAFGPPAWSALTIAPATIAAQIEGKPLELPAFLCCARRTR